MTKKKGEPVTNTTYRKTGLVVSCPHCHKSSRIAVALVENDDRPHKTKQG